MRKLMGLHDIFSAPPIEQIPDCTLLQWRKFRSQKQASLFGSKMVPVDDQSLFGMAMASNGQLVLELHATSIRAELYFLLFVLAKMPGFGFIHTYFPLKEMMILLNHPALVLTSNGYVDQGIYLERQLHSCYDAAEKAGHPLFNVALPSEPILAFAQHADIFETSSFAAATARLDQPTLVLSHPHTRGGGYNQKSGGAPPNRDSKKGKGSGKGNKK